jgi:acyl-CoA thioester hydrolase
MAVMTQIPVLWGDMDALGHVNNTRFFVWFECARIDYFGRIGLGLDLNSEEGPILASTQCDFLKPVLYPSTVEVETSVTKIGNTSFVMSHEIRNLTRESCVVAKGSGVVVLLDYKTGQKVPVSEKLKAAIAKADS